MTAGGDLDDGLQRVLSTGGSPLDFDACYLTLAALALRRGLR
jgi:hypothetical protein